MSFSIPPSSYISKSFWNTRGEESEYLSHSFYRW